MLAAAEHNHLLLLMLMLVAAMAVGDTRRHTFRDRTGERRDARRVSSAAGASGAQSRRAQSTTDKGSAPRRSLLQTYTSDVPLAGLSVQVLRGPPLHLTCYEAAA